MNQATLDFIRQHQDDDVRQLAFLGSKYPEVDMPFALDQIRGRKMARVKLPRWASIDGIIYPPHISMEQCSSEQTALYKAELAARLLGLSPSSSENGEEKEKESENASNLHLSENCEFAGKGAVDSEFAKNEATCEKQQILTESEENVNEIKEEPHEGDFSEEIGFVDLTGGFGVDFSYIASRLGVKSMYVERQAHLCEAAKENFGRLGLKNAIVKNGDGIEVLHSFASKKEAAASDSLGITEDQSQSLFKTNLGLKLIFIDPARRDDAGNKVVSLKDCTPDVTLLQEEMLSKADYVIIKLSPMLDWHRAVSELNCVQEVHIISVNNECKELLLVLSARNMGGMEASSADGEVKHSGNLRIYCVNDAQSFVCDELDIESSSVRIAPPVLEEMQYLYEPNASLMKAGCFGVLSGRYDARMLSKNSHLFVSQAPIEAFPGRSFRIIAVSSFNKKELKRHLSGITKANIAIRNFPLSVAELRKRLKLKDGGETYIFATTLSDESHVLVITEKA
ncbi:class I SAM-dependent methyltransferase [Prevotella copri]|uniref:Class I SAM-dependent methyltransferase n=1 Tax=Segatella copri TaxID=165179 RepID=A0AAW4NB64_9BACT|nr:class I SAM-dependent methyltransferase [Segatella copri]MBU9910957.1 class I SAM-dependent methyltransferase [Segatella copri]MBV3398617.1 class I SAM-dependent methyltransferase [Segatella copri]MBV3408305.1 class I SAM-dependent methyltransferase [Segatella copri]MBV3411393.1 class I SAM-dependent methyltransferase [Segatella copri]MBV3419687.1 class I SAM-dependent methyltransferase [Segatella copri]